MFGLGQLGKMGVGGEAAAGGGGGASLPAGVIARWSADAITPQADNTNLTSWTDSVGGFAATQGTPAAQPQYRTNRLNGKPSVQFGGAAGLDAGRPAALLAANTAQIITVFVVFRNLGTSFFGALATWGKNDTGGMLYADGVNVGSYFDNTSGIIPLSTQGSFSTIGQSTNKGYVGAAGGGVDRVYVNGGCVVQSSALAALAGAAGTFCIGAGNSAAALPVNAEIFDVIFWNVALTPAQMIQVQKWACDKYAQPYPWAAAPYIAVYHGDSIMVGVGITGNSVAATAPYQSAQALSLPYGTWYNLGIGGATMAEMTSTGAPGGIDGLADIATATGKPLKVVAFEWWNQKAASPGPKNNTLAYLAARRAANIKIAMGTSTGSASDPDANRTAYNADIVASAASADAIVRLDLDAQIGTSGANAAHPTNWSDVVHLSNAGYVFLAPMLTSGINAL